MNLPHALDRTVLIRARRPTVFSFFTDSARFASWWGPGSSIDCRPGGAVRICYPGGVVASGSVIEVEQGRRIVFGFGYESGQPIAPGMSRVTITLRDDKDGTVVELRHEFAESQVRDQHVQGWRYHLSVFANVASRQEHGGAAQLVAQWFAAWSETDTARRGELLAACCAADVTFRDQWSALASRDELAPHIGAAQQFMPGIRLVQLGAVRHCQGTLLADWQMQQHEKVLGGGTNVFELTPDGRIARVVGIAAATA